MARKKQYDLIVVGSGAGMNVASQAVAHGMRVAIVEKGPLGGTCLNRGCIPSKVMLYPADVIRAMQDAESIGIHASVDQIDFQHIMKRTRDIVLEDRQHMERGVAHSDQLVLYPTEGSFVADYTLRVGDELITAKKIIIASGARPFIPPIEGLSDVGYLTSATVLDIQELPSSLVIVGGGYIASEFAHFFSAMGSEVTVVGRNRRLVPEEDPEISEALLNRMSEYCMVYTNHTAVAASSSGGLKTIVARDRGSNERPEFAAEEILVAAGRISNADILRPEKSGVETDDRAWIVVDSYLRTTKEGIWALGDALGRHMFRHTANYHSQVVWDNAFGQHLRAVNEHAVPHAVFTYPQIASVGLTTEQAMEDHDVLVGTKWFSDVAKGYAMGDRDGFVKVVVEEESGAILGAQVFGPHAAMLLQPLVYLMNTEDSSFWPLARAQTIHPALSEVVVGAFGNLRPVGEHSHDHAH